MKRKEIKKILKENNQMFLGLLKIDKECITAFSNRFINYIQQSIQVIPLYGGGVNRELKYEVIIAFKNDNPLFEIKKGDYFEDGDGDITWLIKERELK